MAGKQKWDRESVLREARDLVLIATTERELVELLHTRGVNIPRTSFIDVRRDAGFPTYGDFVASVTSDAAASMEGLKLQNKALRKVVDRQQAQLSNRAWLKDEVASQMALATSVEVPPPARMDRSLSPQTGVLMVSDSHNHMSIPQGALGPLFSGYDWGIAQKRWYRTFQAFVHLCQQQPFPVEEVEVFVLGDLIEHSNMRFVQPKTVSAHVIKQSIDTTELLIGCIQMLCGQFPKVKVRMVAGNHSRATSRYGDNVPSETHEHFIYYCVQRALSGQPNLEFEVPEAWYFIANIHGWKFLGLHSEDVLSYVGTPWYGLGRLVKDYSMIAAQASMAKIRSLALSDTMTVGEFLDMMNVPDYVCIGHHHTRFTWDIMGVEALANGAMSGVGFYAAKKRRVSNPPSQRCFFVHPEHGVGVRIPIDLSEVT